MEDTIIGAATSPPRELDARELNQAVDSVIFGDDLEKVVIGGVTVTIDDIKWGHERRMMGVLAPYLRTLMDATFTYQLEEAIGALLVEAQYDLTRLAIIALVPRASQFFGAEEMARFKAIEDRNERYSAIALALEAWLDENAKFAELVSLVRKQIERNKLADELGKLWQPGALHLKALRLLSILESRVTLDTPSNSISLPVGTEPR